MQKHYWGVGMLRYWTLANLPNFLLAAPALGLAAAGVAAYVRANARHMATGGLVPLDTLVRAWCRRCVGTG